MKRKRLARPVAHLAILLATSLTDAAAAPGETPVAADGIVVEVDPVQATLLVDHGPIEGLLASARTEFPAEDARLLEGVRAGDHIRFEVAPVLVGYGMLTITELHVHRRVDLVGLVSPSARLLVAVLVSVLLVQSAWLLRERRRARARDRKLVEEQEELRRALAAVTDRLRTDMSPAAPHSAPSAPAFVASSAADGVDLLPLVVVQPGEEQVFRHLAERLAPTRVSMIWDRRRYDRRTRSARVPLERRRRDRRRPPPVTWPALRYLVAERAGRHSTVLV